MVRKKGRKWSESGEGEREWGEREEREREGKESGTRGERVVRERERVEKVKSFAIYH